MSLYLLASDFNQLRRSSNVLICSFKKKATVWRNLCCSSFPDQFNSVRAPWLLRREDNPETVSATGYLSRIRSTRGLTWVLYRCPPPCNTASAMIAPTCLWDGFLSGMLKPREFI